MRAPHQLTRAGRAAALAGTLLAALAAAAAHGQYSPKPPPDTAPAIIPKGAKLDIDPTEQIDITGWWSNGTVLLHVAADGAFVKWNQPNRYRDPAQRGRWHRQTYRTFWIEPYFNPKTAGTAPPRIRCALRRTGGVLLLDVGSALGLAQSATPPRAPEDAHVGRWSGPGGTLDLANDGSWTMTSAPPPNSAAQPSVHSGRWTYDGTVILLFRGEDRDAPLRCVPVVRPGSPAADGTATTQVVALTTPAGELRRLPAPPPAAVKAPAAAGQVP